MMRPLEPNPVVVKTLSPSPTLIFTAAFTNILEAVISRFLAARFFCLGFSLQSLAKHYQTRRLQTWAFQLRLDDRRGSANQPTAKAAEKRAFRWKRLC